MNPADAPTVLGMLHKQMTSELGTSEITREDPSRGRLFYGSVSGAPLRDEMGRLLEVIHTGEVNYAWSKAVSMAKSTPITIPTDLIGSSPRPADLIERVAKGDSEDPNLAPI
jgi:hypothetical protein